MLDRDNGFRGSFTWQEVILGMPTGCETVSKVEATAISSRTKDNSPKTGKSARHGRFPRNGANPGPFRLMKLTPPKEILYATMSQNLAAIGPLAEAWGGEM
jgi:hypothetical protein